MEHRLIPQQTQRLILSPQIRQYLKLLQIPITDLSQAVEVELAENPLLEEKPRSALQEDFTEAAPVSAQDEKDTREVTVGDSYDRIIDWDFPAESFGARSQFSDLPHEDLQRKMDFQQQLITEGKSLNDFLSKQLRVLDLSDKELGLAEFIIGNIDEHGYLRISVDEICAAQNVSQEIAEKILSKVQSLDPAGVGARDLREALLIQLKRKGLILSPAGKIVDAHMDLLQKRNFTALRKALKCSEKEVQDAVQIIRKLDPRPGRKFYAEESIAVTPDATVSINDNDSPRFKIEVHHEKVPELRINSYYRQLIRQKDTDPKTKEFIREKLQSALNFIKALEQRKSTLRSITEEIVKAQPDFFEKGFSHLKPLRLKDIAEELGIHESTVSRAINGKFMATPQGTIPYKSFFSSKLQTVSGEDESQKSIMERIKFFIDKEDPRRPLSDQELVKMLKAEGIMIARRTVAKYRDLLKVLPSHLRRVR